MSTRGACPATFVGVAVPDPSTSAWALATFPVAVTFTGLSVVASFAMTMLRQLLSAGIVAPDSVNASSARAGEAATIAAATTANDPHRRSALWFPIPLSSSTSIVLDRRPAPRLATDHDRSGGYSKYVRRPSRRGKPLDRNMSRCGDRAALGVFPGAKAHNAAYCCSLVEVDRLRRPPTAASPRRRT